MMRGTHTPRSLENMSKKKRLLAVASDLGPGSCSAAMTEGRGGEGGGQYEEGLGCKWRMCDGPMVQPCVTCHASLRIEARRGEWIQMRTFLVGDGTHCRGSDTVHVDSNFGARVCDGGTATGIMRDAKQWVRAGGIHLSLRRPEVGITTVTRLRD